MAEKKQEVAKVAEAGLPDFMAHMAPETAGLGNSKDPRDNAMPFLAILQKGSPQVNEEESSYIEGAKAGMLINTATGRLYDGKTDGIVVIPCGIARNYVEWMPNRGGWAGSHPFDTELVRAKLGAHRELIKVDGKERRVIMTRGGNLLVETLYTFVIDETGMPMVIGASSTALGPMRKWMSYRRTQINPSTRAELPAFAKRYRLTTSYEKNDSGDWYNWKFADVGFVSQHEYEQALEFAKLVAAGQVVIGRPDDFGEAEDSVDDINV